MSGLIFKDSAVLFYGACYFFLLWVLVNWSLKREIPYQLFVGSFVMLLSGLYLSVNGGISVSENELVLLAISGILSYFISIGVSRKLAPKINDLFKEEKNDNEDNKKYITLIEEAVKLSVFFIPFLFLTNLIMQVVLPVFKVGENAPNSVIEHLGTFGDFFGGTLNPVLTFATFIALIATILIQLKELRLTREELKNSNMMLEMSKDEQANTVFALRDQEQNQRVQQFESTFFKLYEMLASEQNNIKDSVDHLSSSLGTTMAPNLESFIQVVFSNEKVNRYFINLYQLLKLVSRQEIFRMSFEGKAEKQELEERWMVQLSRNDEFNRFYYDLVRSMSYQSFQMLLLFNSSVSKCGAEDLDCLEYRIILENSAFFEHLDLVNIFKTKLDWNSYQKSLERISELKSDVEIDEFGHVEYLIPDEFVDFHRYEMDELYKENSLFESDRKKFKILSKIVDEHDVRAFGESKFYRPFLDLSQKFRLDLN